jgi:hypothetical protein
LCLSLKSPRSWPRVNCLHITTRKNEQHEITYRLKDLEVRPEPGQFVRLGRGTLANIDCIVNVNVMPGGTHVAVVGQPDTPSQPPPLASHS